MFDSLQSKKEFFKTKFPNYLTENLESLDSKHSRLLETLQQEDWLDRITEGSLRNSSIQDDIGAPTCFQDYIHRDGSKMLNGLKFLQHKVRFRKLNSELRGSIKDDISIMKYLNYEKILVENPVTKSPGKPSYAKIDGYFVNNRWMRYLYLASRIIDTQVLPDRGVWVDIGSYYGGLQGILFKYKPETKIVLVDFHHQLFRSYAYLSSIYPNATHNLGIEAVLKSSEIGSLNYVHVSDFHDLKDLEVTLVTNFFSFGEMKRSTFNDYVQSDVVKNSQNLYFVNRFVSAPFFEPTYDSDLSVIDYDFPDFRLVSLDVFPIHHFNLLNRSLFGILRFRNTSSSYFEGIWKQASGRS